MYTIKQASLRSGVSVPLLRQWERRYDVVQPGRTDSGYRMYDEAAIERLRLMRELVDDGWSPSAAAGHVRGLADQQVSDARIDRGSATDEGPPTSGDDLTRAFLAASASLRAGAIESVLDDMFARGSFEQVATRYLMPALRALGESWAQGAIDVAAEHVGSAAVLRRLAIAYQGAARGDVEGPVVLIGLPPGARHELGALAFAVMARRSGLHVVYLGPDLPVDDWLRSAEQTDAAVAVIGVVSPRDEDAASDVATALRTAFPELVIAFGGGASGQVPDDADAHRLPEDLVAATAVLRGLVPARRPSPAGRRPRSG